MEKGETVEIDAGTMLILAKNRIDELERIISSSRALVAEKDKALEGLLRDMHTGSSTVQRGSLGKDGLGCNRPCQTCREAYTALALTEEEMKE